MYQPTPSPTEKSHTPKIVRLRRVAHLKSPELVCGFTECESVPSQRDSKIPALLRMKLHSQYRVSIRVPDSNARPHGYASQTEVLCLQSSVYVVIHAQFALDARRISAKVGGVREGKIAHRDPPSCLLHVYKFSFFCTYENVRKV